LRTSLQKKAVVSGQGSLRTTATEGLFAVLKLAEWLLLGSGHLCARSIALPATVLYEPSKWLGHSNIKMPVRYADLATAHIVKTGNASRERWSKMEPQPERRDSGAAQSKIGQPA
jgi:hypothetical protein